MTKSNRIYLKRKERKALQTMDLYNRIIEVVATGSSLLDLYSSVRVSQYRVFILLSFASSKNKKSLATKAILHTEIDLLEHYLLFQIDGKLAIAEANKKKIEVEHLEKQKAQLQREANSFRRDKKMHMLHSQLNQLENSPTLEYANKQFFDQAKNSLYLLHKKAPVKIKCRWFIQGISIFFESKF